MSHKLFIGSLSGDTKEKDLAPLLARFGPINKLDIVYEKNSNKCKGFGFVTFRNKDSAEKALRANIIYKGRKVIVRRQLTGDKLTAFKKGLKMRRLYVGGLPPDCTDADLRQAFKRYGGIEAAFMIKNFQTGKKASFGYVIFQERASVERAIARVNYIKGKEVKCEQFLGRKRGFGGPGGDYGGGGFRGDSERFEGRNYGWDDQREGDWDRGRYERQERSHRGPGKNSKKRRREDYNYDDYGQDRRQGASDRYHNVRQRFDEDPDSDYGYSRDGPFEGGQKYQGQKRSRKNRQRRQQGQYNDYDKDSSPGLDFSEDSSSQFNSHSNEALDAREAGYEDRGYTRTRGSTYRAAQGKSDRQSARQHPTQSPRNNNQKGAKNRSKNLKKDPQTSHHHPHQEPQGYPESPHHHQTPQWSEDRSQDFYKKAIAEYISINNSQNQNQKNKKKQEGEQKGPRKNKNIEYQQQLQEQQKEVLTKQLFFGAPEQPFLTPGQPPVYQNESPNNLQQPQQINKLEPLKNKNIDFAGKYPRIIQPAHNNNNNIHIGPFANQSGFIPQKTHGYDQGHHQYYSRSDFSHQYSVQQSDVASQGAWSGNHPRASGGPQNSFNQIPGQQGAQIFPPYGYPHNQWRGAPHQQPYPHSGPYLHQQQQNPASGFQYPNYPPFNTPQPLQDYQYNQKGFNSHLQPGSPYLGPQQQQDQQKANILHRDIQTINNSKNNNNNITPLQGNAGQQEALNQREEPQQKQQPDYLKCYNREGGASSAFPPQDRQEEQNQQFLMGSGNYLNNKNDYQGNLMNSEPSPLESQRVGPSSPGLNLINDNHNNEDDQGQQQALSRTPESPQGVEEEGDSAARLRREVIEDPELLADSGDSGEQGDQGPKSRFGSIQALVYVEEEDDSKTMSWVLDLCSPVNGNHQKVNLGFKKELRGESPSKKRSANL